MQWPWELDSNHNRRLQQHIYLKHTPSASLAAHGSTKLAAVSPEILGIVSNFIRMTTHNTAPSWHQNHRQHKRTTQNETGSNAPVAKWVTCNNMLGCFPVGSTSNLPELDFPPLQTNNENKAGIHSHSLFIPTWARGRQVEKKNRAGNDTLIGRCDDMAS